MIYCLTKHRSNDELNVNKAKYNEICFSLSDARSLANKMDSLVDMFREKDLHFALINETWFQNNKQMKRELQDIECAEKIDFICKNRGRRGGGVAIAFDSALASFKPMAIAGNKFELVGAVGRTKTNMRKCVVFSLYIPPKQTVATTQALFSCLGDAIEQAKQDYDDPYIIIGGDTNRRDIGPAIEDFPDIQITPTGPTRGTATLDIVATNLGSDLQTETFYALETANSATQSDHLTIIGKARMQNLHIYTTSTHQVRKYTSEAEEAFGKDLIAIDWTAMQAETPTQSADKLTFILNYLYNKHFPLKDIMSRSCDPPWFTKRIKRSIRNRKREYARSGRSARWKKKKEKCERLIEQAKKAYFERIKKRVKEAGNTRCYFQAVNMLQATDAATRWAIQSMFPGLSDKQIAEKAAEFFNSISQEYRGVEKPVPNLEQDTKCPEMYEISARLKIMKKPRSMVEGDIDPRLVGAFADILAIPLHYIYQQVYSQLEWPTLWTTETVTLIPKVPTPDSLAQLRNLSCTPLFSKCLESFVLENLKKQVQLGRNQFGGIKGTGVNHFLIETWDEIMNALEDPNAAAIDFEKAFNRMSHGHCLNALKRLNAKENEINMVHAFLFGRTMRVKVGGTLSVPRTVPGGSPQGSILGNFLFCVSTSELSEEHDQINLSTESTMSFGANGVSGSDVSSESCKHVSPIARPIPPDQDLSALSGSDDSINFGNFNRRRPILEDTVLSERYNQDEIDDLLGEPVGWTEQAISTKVYIDDLNTIEKVKQSTAVSVLSANRPVIKPHAIMSERNFERIKVQAENIGMRVNSEKTQLLCITGNTVNSVQSYIRTSDGKEITSGTELKILGFWFGPNPNVNVHVSKLKDKFRSRLWSLRHLKRSGMQSVDLLFVYLTIIRPVLDFAVPAYHPLLSATETANLESLQKRALKIVFDARFSYRESLALANISTLKDRREELTRKFAYSSLKNTRYTDGWFPQKPTRHYETRKQRPYLEKKPRTERFKKNPLTFMRKLLNDNF